MARAAESPEVSRTRRTAQAHGKVGPVFYASLVVAGLFILWGVLFTESLTRFNTAAMGVVVSSFGWVYILATTLFIAFLLFLALSRFGQIRLGKDHERPEFSTVSWLAMLFSAGMGVGLVFYGVAEPMSHLASPPLGIGEPLTIEAGQRSMQYTFFHWGLHAWAIYGLVGLALAYFQFRKGASGLISSAFYPLLGERVHGPIGWTIDVLAIFVTALGVATSFGISATQMNSGLNYVFGLPEGLAIQVVIIVVVLCLFLASALSGLDKGIKYLSNLNMILMGAVMLFVLAVGPRLFVLDTFVASIGNYLQNFLAMSFTSGAFVGEEGTAWLEGWTLYYWAWWMMWVMWVGTFIARVSRGRTIREFVAGVLLVPSVLSFLWFSVLGGTAISEELFGGGGIADAVAESLDTALFVTFDQFPGAAVISIVAILLIGSFFITSADSAAFVLAMLSTNGDQNPTARMKVLWGVLIAVFAFVLLLAGGLQAVQQVAIITGVPFTILLIGMAVSLYTSVTQDAFPGLRPHMPHMPGVARREARREHRHEGGPDGIPSSDAARASLNGTPPSGDNSTAAPAVGTTGAPSGDTEDQVPTG